MINENLKLFEIYCWLNCRLGCSPSVNELPKVIFQSCVFVCLFTEGGIPPHKAPAQPIVHGPNLGPLSVQPPPPHHTPRHVQTCLLCNLYCLEGVRLSFHWNAFLLLSLITSHYYLRAYFNIYTLQEHQTNLTFARVYKFLFEVLQWLSMR